jgi:SIR2-like domain
MRVILKVHGCISDPQKTVLSRTQYHRARREFPEYFNLLDSLFVGNTLLFIGCSLVDPDFTLLLENTNIKCPSAHPHYAVLEGGQAEPLRLATRTVYNVHCLEYTAGQHHEVVEGLKDLHDRVDDWRRTHP